MASKDTAGVIAPPPLIFLAALLVGFGIEYAWPSASLAGEIGYPAGAVLALSGLVFAVSAIRGFRRANTNVEPWRPSTALVIGGPYRFTRNPMYAGLTLVYLGITAAFGGVWAAATLLLALVVMHYGVIAREERYMEAKFGEAYRDYKASVRRWL